MDMGYASHAPILGALLARTHGPVLELGCGWTSTPMIHYACVPIGWKVLSADNDMSWLMVFGRYRCTGLHELRLVRHPGDVMDKIKAWVLFAEEVKCLQRWELCLVDHAPGEARVPVMLALKGYVRYFVVHDLEADEPGGGGNYGWKNLKGVFKYESILKSIRPWTGVFSDIDEFPLVESDYS